MNFSANPNPSYDFPIEKNIDFLSEFELSDYYLQLDHGLEDDSSLVSSEIGMEGQAAASADGNNNATSNVSYMKCENEGKKKKVETGHRIAFKMKSEMEVVDDGYKWRKYGKKSVKNSPNPRNYYKCSSGGCHVKKRIERDRDDSSFVITTYEGVHNHESPTVAYYTQNPGVLAPIGITLHPSDDSPLSSFSS